ncbi:Kinesin light chain [Seminavis robusta]|uniref:Kinesin light chain n=1 Tax=Seminavis robusta TaxID=568900 RepID=A0A9N8E8W2_9STRA|nr:Kinesin light chain [Seminavis robusta]|eukprot:Sro753_g197410.1 Kinesin light chain (606) ;mRNA; f:33640-35552
MTIDDKALLGVSIHYLQTSFLEEVTSTEPLSRNSSIHQIEDLESHEGGVIRRKGADRVCPIDGKTGAAYVHCLQGKDSVGTADYMLSYSRSYTIGDIVDSLVDFCARNQMDPKRVYVWICCLCINQHRVAAQKLHSGMLQSTPIDFLGEFQGRVTSIGHLLPLMQPWDRPQYIQRTWCIFELFTAHLQGCDVTIVMPPREALALEQALFGGEGEIMNVVYDALAKTRVEDAQASVETDRLAILELIQKGPGFAAVNRKVNQLIRLWVRQNISEIVDKSEDISARRGDFLAFAKRCDQACELYLAAGEYHLAQEVAEKALSIQNRHGPMDLITKARYYHSVGKALNFQGDYDGALANYQTTLQLRQSALPPHDPEIATAHNFIGAVLRSKAYYEEALVECRKALAIREMVLGEEHTDTAYSYYCIGNILAAKNEYQEALTMLRKGLAIRERLLGDNPQTARSHTNLAEVLLNMGDCKAAVVQHEAALNMRLALLGRSHPDTAWSFYCIGKALASTGNYKVGLENLTMALAIDQTVLGLDHPDIATIQIELGNVLVCAEDYDGALPEYKAALEIHESSLGRSHPDSAKVRGLIDEVAAKIQHKGHVT